MAERSQEKVTVEVDGRPLQLTNLHKVLYPQTGFTKGAVIDYYTRIAPVLLPHLADRALTIKRYPNGVDEKFFFEKNAARGTPAWVRTVDPARAGLDEEPRDDRLRRRRGAARPWSGWPTSPRWSCTCRSGTSRRGPASRAPTCSCSTSTRARRRRSPSAARSPLLAARPARRGRRSRCSRRRPGRRACRSARRSRSTTRRRRRSTRTAVAKQLEAAHPKLVVSRMTKSLRGGKVLVDWSQNNPAKTTVAPYSLRARDEPTVSTPLTWDEVEAGGSPRFTSDEVLDRVERVRRSVRRHAR